MHCELIVPGLFAAPAPARLPALELLLARGRCASAQSQRLEDWLREACELPDAPLAAGALSVLGAGGEPGDAFWARADPVHLELMRERLILVPGAALGVTREEAAALAETLQRHLALDLRAITPTAWAVRLDGDFELDAPSPLELAGRDVELGRVPGSGAAAAHRVLNEAQMALHEHPVNAAREARGQPALNSIWLWGFGRAPRNAAGRWRSVTTADPVALGLARLSGKKAHGLARGAQDWLARMPEDGRHLIVLDGLRLPLALGEKAQYETRVGELERDWFAPLLAALRSGRIGMVTIHVPDGPECSAYETIRADLRRFWRRPKALQRYGA